MAPRSPASGRPPAASLRLLAALLAAVAGCLLGLGAPEPVEAGIKGKAKKLTREQIKARGGQPVKVSCRRKGRKGRDGVKCKWVYAELIGTARVRNCKGESLLKKKRGKLRFKRRSCKADRGAGLVIEGLPERLLKEGYESTWAFCFTTLGRGYKCKWEGLRFQPAVIEDCRGGATSRDRKVTISLSGCSRNEAASAAQAQIKAQLRTLDLDPGRIDCRPGDPLRCEWSASTSSAGWTYVCDGSATGSDPYGSFRLDPCDLRAPSEAPLTPALGPHPEFGVNDVWPSFPGQATQPADHFAAETARFTVNWVGIQPDPPGPSAGPVYDWSQPDTVYSSMVAAGIEPILIVQGAPCWATDDPCSAGEYNHPPALANLGDWADFVAAVAERYPQARAIEVWNEANADLFFEGAPRPSRYAKILEAAYDAVKGVEPEMPVITTGLAPFAGDAPGARRYDEFLRDLFREGIKGHFDAIAHHGYTGRLPHEDYEQSIRIQLADLKDVMLDYGEQDTDIWITETGITNKGPKPFDEGQQATAMTRLYRQYRRIPGVPVVIVHRWRDDDGAKGDLVAEAGYGLQRANGSWKPAYCALAAARPASAPPSC